MDPIFIGIIAVVVLLALIFLGAHIAIALGVVGFVGLILIGNLNQALSLTAHSFFATVSHYTFTVLPLFIIMGHFAAASGVSERAYNFAAKWLSNLPAGLYLVTTGSCALFASVTGSGAATTVAVGKAVLPEMEKHGYDKRLSLGCVAASGTLGVLIPPSIPLVVYGIITEESIGRLLLAGVIPGALSAAIYMLGMSLIIRFKPHLGPPATKYAWKERFQAVPGIWGCALLFGIIMGGIYSGVFTPTEAGAWGAFAAIIMVVFKQKRRFFNEAKNVGFETTLTASMIFFLIMTAMVFSQFLTLAGVVYALLDFIIGGEFSPVIILTLFIALCVLMGMFMTGTATLLLIAPIMHGVLIPLGYDGIWLGIIMVKMFELAVITPPVGASVFVAKALVPDIPVEEVFRGIAPFAVMDLLTVVVLVAFPQISIWLPTMAFG